MALDDDTIVPHPFALWLDLVGSPGDIDVLLGLEQDWWPKVALREDSRSAPLGGRMCCHLDHSLTPVAPQRTSAIVRVVSDEKHPSKRSLSPSSIVKSRSEVIMRDCVPNVPRQLLYAGLGRSTYIRREPLFGIRSSKPCLRCNLHQCFGLLSKPITGSGLLLIVTTFVVLGPVVRWS